MEMGKAGGVSVLEPIGIAINKTKQVLFSPFNLEKWFLIGFCAWLAGLGSGGGGGGFNFRCRPSGCSPNVGQIRHEIGTVLSQAMPWLIPVAVVALFFGLAIALLVVWLKSRGQFMFLDCIVRNRGAVTEPWKTYKAEGNSLFGFKFILGLAVFTLSAAAFVPLVVIFIGFAQTDFKVLLIGPMIGAGVLLFALFLLGVVYGLVAVLTDDFVVPVMMLRRCGVIAAWKEFWGLFSAHLGRFILYLLIIFAAGFVLGLLMMMVLFAACCCVCCVSWVLLIPIIGSYVFAVLVLPLSVWRRSYAVLFLAQFGGTYDVFAIPESSAPPATDALEAEPAASDRAGKPQTPPDVPEI